MRPDFSTRTPETRCPYCEAKLDAASHMDGPLPAKPTAGDFTVCIYCAQVLILDDQIRPRKPIPGEVEAVFRAHRAFARRIEKIQRAIRSVDRRDAHGTRS